MFMENAKSRRIFNYYMDWFGCHLFRKARVCLYLIDPIYGTYAYAYVIVYNVSNHVYDQQSDIYIYINNPTR